MRSLIITILSAMANFAVLGCQSQQHAVNHHPYPKGEIELSPSNAARPEGYVTLNHPEAGLPFGENEERTIGRMMLSNQSSYRAPQAENIFYTAQPPPVMEQDVARQMEKAAALLPPQFGILIVSAYRPLEEQLTLIKRNCGNPSGYKNCDPKPTYPETCMPASGLANTCPHTTGRAVDAWAVEKIDGQWQQTITQSQCLMGEMDLEASAAACARARGQTSLIEAMKKSGFCVSQSQPWHFENPKLTRDCFF